MLGWNRGTPVLVLSLCLGSAGCGAGTAAAVSGGGSSGGTASATPSISAFRVIAPKQPDTCRIEFILATDAPRPVAFYYQAPSQGERRIEAFPNPQTFGAGTYSLEWSFTDEVDLPDDGSFLDDVRVRAEVLGGSQELLAGANGGILGLGNDDPTVAFGTVLDELSGASSIPIAIADSSEDEVSIRVEYESATGWTPARPVGLPAELATPETWLTGVVAPAGGTELVFTWDSTFDLPGFDDQMRLRVLVADPVDAAATTEAEIRVDNNDPPVACLQGEFLLANTDRKEGIPIPYELINEEAGDELDVVLQWATDSGFPPLPDDPSLLRSLLDDDVAGKQFQVCRELPRMLGGRLRPRGASRVELPELASTAAELHARGVEGTELELMRPASVPRRVSDDWATNPLEEPVGAVPIEEGLQALVLDAPNSGIWRLSRIDLATGEASHLQTGIGLPSALVRERTGGADQILRVLVAFRRNGQWRIDRVELDPSGVERTELVAGKLRGELHGLVSFGSQTIVATVGDALVRINRPGAPEETQVVLADDLPGPRGLVRDPAREDALYLALRDAPVAGGFGDVVSFDLRGLTWTSVRAPAAGTPLFPEPTALTIDASGTTLSVLCSVGGEPELLALNTALAGHETAAIGRELRSGVSSMATDKEGVLVLSGTDGSIYAAGGVEQRRTIVSYDPATRVVSVDEPFRPSLRSEQAWRVAAPSGAKGVQPGATNVFLWDSSEAPSGGLVTLRVTPLDAEIGQGDQTLAAIDVSPRFAGESGPPVPASCGDDFDVCDFDADGDLDLVVQAGESIAVSIQSSPGTLASPVTLVEAGAPALGGFRVVDLDGDGFLDLLVERARQIEVYWFSGMPVLNTEPTVIDAEGATVRRVAAGDLDRDGLLDVVATSEDPLFAQDFELEVYRQSTPRVFEASRSLFSAPANEVRGASVEAIDHDGDGAVDVVLQHEAGVTLLWQDGPFQVSTTAVDLLSMVEVLFAYPFDGERDGDVDLVLSGRNGSSQDVNVYVRNVGGRSFISSPWAFDSIYAVDLDRDDDLDIVGSNQVLLSEGGAQPSTVASLDVVIQDLADFDGDGRPEAIVYQGCDLGLYTFDTGLTFVATPTVINPGFRSFVAGDLDQDGDLDTVSDGDRSNRQLAPRVFDPAVTVWGGQKGVNGQFTGLVDLDGDLDLDLMAGRWGATQDPGFPFGGQSVPYDQLYVRFQTSPADLSAYESVAGAPRVDNPAGVAVLDYDDDGDLDLVVANAARKNVRLFRHASTGFDGSYITLSQPDVIERPLALAVADLNNDARPDVASANEGSDSVTIFLARRGGFEEQAIEIDGEGAFPASIAAGDLDGDGLVDLVVAGSQILALYQRDGPTYERRLLDIGPASHVRLADIDKDDRLDVLYSQIPVAQLMLQRSPGRFVRIDTQVPSPSTGPFEVLDLDGDGDQDLLAPGTVYWGGQ